MKLVQFHLHQYGNRAGILKNDAIIDITSSDPEIAACRELLLRVRNSGESLPSFIEKIFKRKNPLQYPLKNFSETFGALDPYLLVPLTPPEVWAFGVTYKRSAEIRDLDVRHPKNFYDKVYQSPRPELFFKGTASRVTGTGDYIGIRNDSVLTATEPELAYAISDNKEILGFTIMNDVSAWDLERENPLYLPQSKIFYGCASIGPTLVTPDEFGDPYEHEINVRIIRKNKLLFQESVSTSKLSRKIEDLNHYLFFNNPIPFGSIVSTGTGIMIPNEFSHQDGDRVEITIPAVGTLINTARLIEK